jgi:hypothetical protein
MTSANLNSDPSICDSCGESLTGPGPCPECQYEEGLDPFSESAREEHRRNQMNRWHADDREEHEPCERGTDGCSISHAKEQAHRLPSGTCETW